jgi:hypothetical protein
VAKILTREIHNATLPQPNFLDADKRRFTQILNFSNFLDSFEKAKSFGTKELKNDYTD